MAYIKTDNQNYINIANAIREKNFSNSTYRPNQMAAAIKAISNGIDIDPQPDIYPDGDTWTRPSNYPNLDSINIPVDFDGVYMTYDLNRTPGWGFIGIYVNTSTNNTKYYVERGHLENGEFVADYTAEQTKATYFRQDLDEANGTVQLWRVYSTAHITRFAFVGSGTATGSMRYNATQPCVERRGQLLYVTDCSSYLNVRYNVSDGIFGTFWLERDNLDIGKNSVVTTFSCMYGWCYRLVDVNLNWDTTNWHVTNLSSMFNTCVSLRSVDFSSWDTSNWAVTNLSNMFSSCYALKEIDFSSWDTSKWAVTTLANMFNYCISLKSIDLTDWDVSNWKVTVMNSMFSNCRGLTNVDFSGWDTSEWAVTTLATMFDTCYSLETADLSSWDTSNWEVTAMNSMFSSCYSLKKVDCTNWDTSGWAVTTLASMFSNCWALKDIKISSWDTSAWKVTTLASMFNCCYALESIDLSWDTAEWAVTTFVNMFDYCRSLKTLDFSSWDTSAWKVTTFTMAFRNCFSLTEIVGLGSLNTSLWEITTLANVFDNCLSLKSLDLSGWDTSNWVVTTTAHMFTWCQSLETLDIGEWDTSGWKVTAMNSMFNECKSLRVIDLSDWDTSLFALTNCQSMISYCTALETLYMPDDFTTTTFKVTSANNQIPYSTTAPCLKNFNGYPIGVNTNWSSFYCLSAESLVSIINKLPTVSVARTLTLGVAHKQKLTTEQIAVATGKGWTVA